MEHLEPKGPRCTEKDARKFAGTKSRGSDRILHHAVKSTSFKTTSSRKPSSARKKLSSSTKKELISYQAKLDKMLMEIREIINDEKRKALEKSVPQKLVLRQHWEYFMAVVRKQIDNM